RLRRWGDGRGARGRRAGAITRGRGRSRAGGGDHARAGAITRGRGRSRAGGGGRPGGGGGDQGRGGATRGERGGDQGRAAKPFRKIEVISAASCSGGSGWRQRTDSQTASRIRR